MPPPAETPSEQAQRLTLAIARGERRAEEEFVRRYGPGLVAILRVHCSEGELCKDLAQETLRIALVRMRAGRIAEPAAISGFLRGTALNLLANELRRSERRLVDKREDWMADAVSESSDPYDTVESEDLARAAREVISSVKVDRDRELLWRFYVDHESKITLCQRFGLSAEHFDRVLHRARTRLKSLWQEYVAHADPAT